MSSSAPDAAETGVPIQRVSVGDVEVAYRRDGSGVPLLVLHDLGLGQRWLGIHALLAGQFDVVAPDHPGFGDTQVAEWMTDFDDLALHYAELANVLALGQFHLLGHGFGAWVAAEFAAFYPERVLTLTLVTPMGVRVAGEPIADLFRMSADGRQEIAFNGRASEVLAGDTEPEPLEAILQDYADLTGYGRFAWNPRYDIRLDRRLKRITSPSLVIAAEEDHIVPRSHAERYTELLPNARLAIVKGTQAPSSHAVFIEEPDAVFAEIDTIAREA